MTFISDHTTLIAVVFIGCFVVWKYIIQPIDNDGKPIEPEELPEEEY